MGKKKTIKLQLSEQSVNAAVKELEEYKNSLVTKTRELVEELGRIGIETITNSLAQAEGDSDTNIERLVEIKAVGNRIRATLYARGRHIMFLEYGAGIHYNGAAGQSPNPNGQKFGYVIGSYGKGHGTEDSWVYYNEETGGFRTSQGTKAVMPMYNADDKIRKEFRSVAKKVFGG